MAEDRAGQVERLAEILREARTTPPATNAWCDCDTCTASFAEWLIERGVTVGLGPVSDLQNPTLYGESVARVEDREMLPKPGAAPPPPKVTDAMVQAAWEADDKALSVERVRWMLEAALRAASSGEA